ncbi:unnamed protein product, partial [Anisakis simplex]|uniref:Synapsin_C domain-containing protein n=1 Tax=Anisakis simplex TaxID=6269 RepID=A0A0M3JNR0_ANISI
MAPQHQAPTPAPTAAPAPAPAPAQAPTQSRSAQQIYPPRNSRTVETAPFNQQKPFGSDFSSSSGSGSGSGVAPQMTETRSNTERKLRQRQKFPGSEVTSKHDDDMH